MKTVGARSSLISAMLISAAISSGLGAGAANAGEHVFKDPYQGGKRLTAGGGEPGKRYMALVEAAYTNECAKMCTVVLGTEKGEEYISCVEKKEICQAMTMYFTNPKSHKVLDGYLKDDEAALDVELTWPEAPNSYMVVTMRQDQGKWQFWGISASATMEVNVEATGSAEFGTPATEEAAPSRPR